MAYLKSERETILRFDYLSQKWYAWTSIPTDAAKLNRFGWKLIHETRENGNVIDAVYEGGKKFMTYRNMTNPARVPKNAFRPKAKEQNCEEDELYE